GSLHRCISSLERSHCGYICIGKPRRAAGVDDQLSAVHHLPLDPGRLSGLPGRRRRVGSGVGRHHSTNAEVRGYRDNAYARSSRGSWVTNDLGPCIVRLDQGLDRGGLVEGQPNVGHSYVRVLQTSAVSIGSVLHPGVVGDPVISRRTRDTRVALVTLDQGPGVVRIDRGFSLGELVVGQTKIGLTHWGVRHVCRSWGSTGRVLEPRVV